MGETGSTDGSSRPLPKWLQSAPAGTGDSSSDANGENNSTDSDTTKAN